MSTLPGGPRRAPFRLRTLGGAALERDGTTIDAVGAQRKLLAFLAILAVSRQRGVGRERVALYLWSESDAQRARGALKQTLHVARQQLGSADAILGTTELRLNPDVIESDIDAFVSALEARDLERAATLYGGPFLDGFHLSGAPDFERWVDVQRSELAQRQAVAVEQLATNASALGDHASAVRWWQVRHRDDPLSGLVTLGLMHALDAVGDRAAAIRCATVYETSLRTELGNPADPAVSALAARLRLESARGQKRPRQKFRIASLPSSAARKTRKRTTCT
jgi:DNA-binding SARP family transcriptional activator